MRRNLVAGRAVPLYTRAPVTSRPPPLVLLASALGAVGLGARVFVAATDHGIFWPDEIYQSLEPAHRFAFGYGLVAWEFIEGARNWALPGLLGVWLKLVSVLGFDSPARYLFLTRLLFIALAAVTAFGIRRFATVLGADPQVAALAAAASLLQVLGLYFSHRAMSENACAAPVVWGLALVVPKEATRRHLVLGASLLGLAVLLRLQCGVFAVGILGILAVQRRFRALGEVLGVLVVWAFLFGLLDRLTWHDAPNAKLGGWFHSALKYWEFNVTQQGAARWGTSPFGFYGDVLWRTMPPVVLVLVVLLLLGAKKAWPAFVLALGFYLLHSATGHKEIRFLVPMVPLAFVVAGVGASQLQGRARAVALVALVGATGFSLVRAPELTFGDLGAYADRPQSSAWKDFDHVNQLLLTAHAQPELCGLRVDVHHAWMGGSTYLHRNAPLYPPGYPANSGLFNFAIVNQGSGLPPIQALGGLELVKLPVNGCAPDPGYPWRLP